MKNLKKLFCMIVAVCVIVCFAAPAVLAAGTGAQDDPYVLEAGVSQQITVPAGGTVYVSIDATNTGYQLSVNGNRTYWNFEVQIFPWWSETPGPSGAAIANLESGGVYNIAIVNLDTEGQATLDVVANLPAPGTEENPDTLVMGSNTAVVEADSWGYNYDFVADVTGLLTITMGEGDWSYVINNMTTYQYGETQFSDSDPLVKSATVAVNAGDEIRVIVNTYDPNSWDIPAGEVSFTASFRVGHGTVEAPFEAHTVNDVSAIEVAAGSLTYIAMNSQLNGMILNVAAQEGIALIVNDVIVPAVDGMFSVELTGVPANKVVVANTTEAAVELNASLEYPLGSEGNPIMIGNAADLSKIDVAAGSTTYIAINAMLNGNYLTIKGDSNTVVEVNGQAVTAKNGVFSVELTGAPMNRVVITNNGNAAATYDAAIGEPIPATGETMMVLPMILAVVCVLGLAVVATKKVAA